MRRAPLLAGVLALSLGAPLWADDPTTETEHVVQADETLGGIANRAEVPRILIIEANGLRAPYAVRAGQRLIIPRRRSHTVGDGETGLSIALDYGVPWRAIAAASGLDVHAPLRTGQRLVIPTVTAATPAPREEPVPTPSASPATSTTRYAWPVSGRIRRAFATRGGSQAFHDGIDIIAPAGTAARASAAGTVIFAGNGPSEYGRTVIIHHGGRWTTTYSFLDRITVREGEHVGAGERIGLVGQTGLATEPQLHFEVRRNRVALDPVRYLPGR
jgi:murein DD-endopeptidase MepM/ murein hydrolase activator NlpD